MMATSHCPLKETNNESTLTISDPSSSTYPSSSINTDKTKQKKRYEYPFASIETNHTIDPNSLNTYLKLNPLNNASNNSIKKLTLKLKKSKSNPLNLLNLNPLSINAINNINN
eukprot:151806_1